MDTQIEQLEQRHCKFYLKYAKRRPKHFDFVNRVLPARELSRQNKWDLTRIAAQHKANAEYITEMK